MAIGHLLGPSGLRTARRLIPVSLKAQLSKFVVSSSPLSGTTIVAGDGHKFLAIDEPVFLHLRMEGYYERALSDITRRVLRPGDTAIDIGANFGWYTMLMCRAVGEAGFVHAVEPNPKMLPVLKRNIELNGYSNRVKLLEGGLGESRTESVLLAESSQSAVGYVRPKGADDDGRAERHSIQVYAMNDVFGHLADSVVLVKMDVEGFEPQVMGGGGKIFGGESPPVLQIEFNVEALKRQGTDIAAFAAKLNALPMKKFSGVSGALVPMDRIDPEANCDIFLFPARGKFSDRLAQCL